MKELKRLPLELPSWAIFSDDGKYRHALGRRWEFLQPCRYQLSISLNPSVAGNDHNDPTIIRDINRAKREGYGGLFKGNLFDLISTDPNALLNDGQEIISDLCDAYLRLMILNADEKILCGWGSFSQAVSREAVVLSLIKESGKQAYCLGVNQNGSPKHPLYIRNDQPIILYSPNG